MQLALVGMTIKKKNQYAHQNTTIQDEYQSFVDSEFAGRNNRCSHFYNSFIAKS
jgi:hypothetical protein